MMEVYLAVDLGSSLIKVLYGNDSNKLPNYVAIEPEVVEVPVSTLEAYRRTNFSGDPTHSCFVEVVDRYYAVGKLARKAFHSTTNLARLKSEYAVQRILAALWVAVSKLEGGKKIKLFLTCLLPPGELKDKQLLKDRLTAALESFDSPNGRLQCRLKYFNCYPEGGGLSLFYQQRHPACKSRTLGVVMLGHRNVSAYIVEDGTSGGFRSSDLGFSIIVRGVQKNTSGYSEGDVTRAVARYLLSGSESYDSSPNSKYLDELLLRQGDVDRKQELAQLVTAVKSAKELYWLSISQWLDTQLSEVADILIGGGTCQMFTKEFRHYVLNLPKIVGRPDSVDFLNAGLKYPEGSSIPRELQDRYADVQCLWGLGLMPVVWEYQGRKQVRI